MRRTLLIMASVLLLVACGAVQPATTSPTQPSAGKLVVMSHDSFSVSEAVIKQFTAQTGATVEFLKAGDTGSALNKAILAKDAPLADVLFGVDNTFLSRALSAEIFEPYESPALADVPNRFRLDPTNRLVPIDFGYVTINYDRAYLAANQLPLPTDLRQLTEPAWRGKLIVQNPATSSPGLAFLLATIARFPEGSSYDWKQFWNDLRANEVLVVDSWDTAYYQEFSGSAGQGPRPLVVSYSTSPAAEVFFSEGQLTEPPTGNLVDGSFLQVEFAGILKGTKQRALAEQFIDFMLSRTFQEDIPLQMFVYPVLPTAQQPAVFTQFAQVPATTVGISPAQIAEKRDSWITEWNRIVLR